MVGDALGGDAVLTDDAALTRESMGKCAVPIEVVPLESLAPDEVVPGFYAPLL